MLVLVYIIIIYKKPIAVRGLDLAGLLLRGPHNAAILADKVGEGRGVDLDNSLFAVVLCMYCSASLFVKI